LSTLRIETARAFAPLLKPSRYKGAWGGRGSGKSHFFAGLAVETAMMVPGCRGLMVREVQKSLAESAQQLIKDKIVEFGLSSQFNVLRDRIETPGGGLFSFIGMQDHTAESVKSLEGYNFAWCEEAHSLSQRSLTLLRPTIRKAGSELWFSWNPTRKVDPVDALLRGPTPPTDAVVVRANWSDNPWLPAELKQERADDERDRPDSYEHTWEGGYVKVTEGAYFASQLTTARVENRIGKVAADPLMLKQAFWDIGGTGRTSDATAIWVAQFIGREIRVVDYYEAQSQPLATHVAWLRSRGHGDAVCILPHDGAAGEKVYDATYEGALRATGFTVRTIKNQGRGAAMMRVEAVRRLFPSIWVNEATCEGGLAALGSYHERKDDKRGIGLGPDHDWSSHGADAFGLMAIAYEQPEARPVDWSTSFARDWQAT
jgi:phage terminase large subunit